MDACKKWILGASLLLTLVACAHKGNARFSPISPIPKSGIHQVKTGETVSSIAWRYGLASSDLMRRNGLWTAYILPGQRLYLRGYPPHPLPNVRNQASISSPPQGESVTFFNKDSKATPIKWVWPARGKIVHSFSPYNKGINIAGKMNDPVYAVAEGKAVYCGEGLQDYGKLIIIKHNDNFLSAYAYNNRLLIRAGESVRSGQKIAVMGVTGRARFTQRAILHFEIRRNGQPVDPLEFLP